jgi:hypothetical protein
MKIVVYNSYDQYALSRNEIELLQEVLPKQFWAKIKEFHLAHSHPKAIEPFEYDEQKRIGYFIMPVKEKTSETRRAAVQELLLGLGRLREKSRFFQPLKMRERADYDDFLEQWLPICLARLDRA